MVKDEEERPTRWYHTHRHGNRARDELWQHLHGNNSVFLVLCVCMCVCLYLFL